MVDAKRYRCETIVCLDDTANEITLLNLPNLERVLIAEARSTIFTMKAKKAGPSITFPTKRSSSMRFVDVPDYKGVGMEITKGTQSAQNLAEAEFLVATYMYLRLKQHKVNEDGKVIIQPLHTAPQIAILTTENA
jgi:hypothetical protein